MLVEFTFDDVAVLIGASTRQTRHAAEGLRYPHKRRGWRRFTLLDVYRIALSRELIESGLSHEAASEIVMRAFDKQMKFAPDSRLDETSYRFLLVGREVEGGLWAEIVKAETEDELRGFLRNLPAGTASVQVLQLMVLAARVIDRLEKFRGGKLKQGVRPDARSVGEVRVRVS